MWGCEMPRYERILERILRGQSDANIDFSDLQNVLFRLGFEERIRGSHHIFTRSDVEEILNLQPNGSKAKAYQVRQVRGILIKYRMVSDDE